MLPKKLFVVAFVSAITICGGAERKIRRTQKVLKHAKNNVANNNNKHSTDITGLKQESNDKFKKVRAIGLFSGGGIKAQIGTMIAISEMDKENLSPLFQYNVGISGGTWGIAAAVYAKATLTSPANQRIDDMLESFQHRAHQENTWGKMRQMNMKTCKRTCHQGWAESIRLNLMTGAKANHHLMGFPKKDLSMLELTTMATTVGLPQPKIFIDIAKKTRFGRSIIHTGGICVVASPDTWCQLDDRKNSAKTEHKYDPSQIKLVIKKRKWLRHVNVGTKTTSLWDFLSFASAAWAEISVKSFGIIKKMPSRVALSSAAYDAAEGQKNKKAETVRFADAAPRCNLPLQELLMNHRTAASAVDKVVVFDFSRKRHLNLQNKCCKFWKEQSGISCGQMTNADPGRDDFAKKLTIQFTNDGNFNHAVEVLLLPFRSMDNPNLAKRYPVVNFIKADAHYWTPDDFADYLAAYRPVVKDIYIPLIRKFLQE